MSEYALTPRLGLYKPTIDADDDLWGDHLNANADVLDAAVGSVANVLHYGADPTGIVDSSPAFAAALAVRRNGKPIDVYAPSGRYLLSAPITVGDVIYAQRLYGDGWGTVLTVGPTFSPGAPGVILTPSGNANEAQASVCYLQIQFQQPPDIATTLTATTAIGSAVLTVANPAGIQVGYYCRNIPRPNSIPFQSTMPKVVSIVGNVVTLDRTAVSAMSSGDTMSFAANRSQMVMLGAAPVLTPGAPGIKYPWAIYSVAKSVFLDHVLVSGAWNGAYIRGSTLVVGQLFVGALNVGMDIDECYNFPKVEHYLFWPFGFSASPAMLGAYYDGTTIAGNIGHCDDFTCDVFQSWCGIVNITSTWSWGSINQLKLDGSNSNLNFLAAGTGDWLHIGSCYSTSGAENIGVPFVFSGAGSVTVSRFYMVQAQLGPGIDISAGSLTLQGGYMWDGIQGTSPIVRQTGGMLIMSDMRFDASTGRTDTYLTQTGGALRVNDSVFTMPAGVGGRAFSLVDNALNAIVNVELNGWTFTAPGPLGVYEERRATSVTHTNSMTLFSERDTPTTAQVALRPVAGFLAAEGKLRFMATFPTGTDTAPRVAVSARSGFRTTSWADPYLDLWFANGTTNDVGSDANMTKMLRVNLLGAVFGSDTLTTGVIVGINGPTNQGRRLQFQAAGVARFELSASSGDTELRINRYDDAGTLVDSPVRVTRSNGAISLPTLAASTSYASDATAAAGGVAVGQLYRNGSAVMVRVV